MALERRSTPRGRATVQLVEPRDAAALLRTSCLSGGHRGRWASLRRPQTSEIGRNLVDLPLGESWVRHGVGMTHIAMRGAQEC